MRNNQTSVYRDQRGTWTDNTPDIIIDDWKKIGEMRAFNRASNATNYNSDGTRKTHKDVKYPNGIEAKNKSPRKVMKYSEGDIINPAKKILDELSGK